jgi:hypothetical protein
VESVERNHNALYVGWLSTQLSGCAVCRRYRDQLSLWKDPEKVIHSLSTRESHFGPIHILEKSQWHACIWGYAFKEISGPNGTSPQARALIHR